MEIWTAEDSAGTIHVISAPASAAEFKERVCQYLEEISEPGSPTELEIYLWPNEHAAGVWLRGDMIEDGMTSWTEMARDASAGRVAYVYPGRFVFLAPGEEAPRPPAGLRPVTEADLDAYELGDPKRVELTRAIDRGGF